MRDHCKINVIDSVSYNLHNGSSRVSKCSKGLMLSKLLIKNDVQANVRYFVLKSLCSSFLQRIADIRKE